MRIETIESVNKQTTKKKEIKSQQLDRNAKFQILLCADSLSSMYKLDMRCYPSSKLTGQAPRHISPHCAITIGSFGLLFAPAGNKGKMR